MLLGQCVRMSYKNKTKRNRIKVGTHFDTLTPHNKIIYKEKNQPDGCSCKGDDLVYGNGTYWYCSKCHLNQWGKQ